MVIQLTGKYRSLSSFISEQLGDFVVITGKNGSGKSQFVQAVSTAAHPGHIQPFKVTITPPQERLHIGTLSYNSGEPLKGERSIRELDAAFNTINSLHHEFKKIMTTMLAKGFNVIAHKADDDISHYFEMPPENQVYDLTQQWNFLSSSWTGDPRTTYINLISSLSKFISSKKSVLLKVLEISQYKKKDIFNFDRNDFISTPFSETIGGTSAFEVQIQSLFFLYARKRFVNEMEYMRKQSHGQKNDSISPEEFLTKFPEPWEQINKMFIEHGLDIRIQGIPPSDFSPEMEFQISLYNVEMKEKVLFEELSSGEQVIAGLIIKLFLSERYQAELKFPTLIVLDEPDANLHPEMSSLLIGVLYQTFVMKLGIKVIITTHSPSTVALAPEDCIYELKNIPKTSLVKISKDDALTILTGNLPLLSIDYQNHRQVFVESPTDQYYYQTLFAKLKAEKQTLHDLYFITVGYGKSNCDDVVLLATELRRAGNKTSFGIVDWDGKRKEEEHIKVLGPEARYSIENFLYDPLLLCVLFLEQKNGNNINRLGFDPAYNQYLLAQEDSVKIKEVIEWFFKQIEARFPVLKFENLKTVQYQSGVEYSLPEWYLTMQGHELDQKLKESFSSLRAFKDTTLQHKMIEISGKCYPHIPGEPLILLKQLSL